MTRLPVELCEEFARGNGSLFIGAGLSMGAGLPSWAALLHPLEAEITGLPEGLSHLDIAQMYVNSFGRRRLVSKLRDALDGAGVQPTPTHAELVKLKVQRIFTTNFDDLIERALRGSGHRVSMVVHDTDISSVSADMRTLVKLHGDLARHETITVTAEDYEGFFLNRPGIADLVKNELQTKTVLFVGYSFNDIDLRMIMTKIGRESRDMRRNVFAVLFQPAPVVVSDLERRGVKVIPIDVPASDPGAKEALLQWVLDFSREIEKVETRARGAAPNGAGQHLALAPVNNNLPPRTGLLRGRDADKLRLIAGLKSRYPVIAVEGFPGVGKTSVAVEVGHDCTPDRAQPLPDVPIFGFVVWISAKDKPGQRRWFEDVLDQVAYTTNNGAIAMSSISNPRQRLEQKRAAVDRLLRVYKILLIIDNYETIDDPELARWITNIPEPSKVLLTTRGRDLHMAFSVHLAGLAPPDALQMMRDFAEQSNSAFLAERPDEDLLRLADVTGGVPHAILLALGLVKQHRMELDEVVGSLRQAKLNQDIHTLFDTLFERAWEGLGHEGQQVLKANALFGVSSVSKETLRAASGLTPMAFTTGLSACLSHNLLEYTSPEKRFEIHPLTRSYARMRLDEDPGYEAAARRRCTAHLLEVIRAAVCRDKPPCRYWNALVTDGMVAIDPEWPLIQEVLEWAEQDRNDELFVDLVMLLVHYMDSRYYNQERLDYVTKAIAALERLGNRKGEEALLRIDALGWTYVEEGRLEEGYREILRGSEILENYRVEDRQDLEALSLAWRARVRIEENKVEEAVEIIDMAVQLPCSEWIKTRVFMAAGDIALARCMSEEALDWYTKAGDMISQYGDEGHRYQIDPRIGLALLAGNRLDEADEKFKDLEGYKQIAIGHLYARYGRAMVAYKRGQTASARGEIDEVRKILARRTTSNLLLKMANKLYESLEPETQGSR